MLTSSKNFDAKSCEVGRGLWFVWCYYLCIYAIAMTIILWRQLFEGSMYCPEFVLRGVGIVSWGSFVIMSLYELHFWIS